jgi:hypothetical protein
VRLCAGRTLRTCLMSLIVLSSSLLWAQAQQQPPAPANFGVSKEAVFWVTFSIMTLLLVFACGFVTVGLLRSPTWNLGDAVSEEAGNQPNPLPAGVKPIMVASSSRLLALLGLLNILAVFLGFGYYFLYTAFSTGQVKIEDMKGVISYLFSGAVMFAPYLANQLQTAFSSFFSGVPQAAAAPVVQGTLGTPPAQPAPVVVRGVAVG